MLDTEEGDAPESIGDNSLTMRTFQNHQAVWFEKVVKKSGQDFEGPTCVFKSIDLGIALGSAVKTASILNVDNRIMYSIGTAAKQLNYLPEASIVMGIPLSAKGKSKYYDRG